MSDKSQTDVPDGQNLRMVYQILCTSYNEVDKIRGQLLGFLPLASSGIFVLLKDMLSNPELSLPIVLFGFFITLGLYIFEIYGTRRCTHLIILGQHLENQLKIEGLFKHRPTGLQAISEGKLDKFCKSKISLKHIFRDFRSLINEPMAAGVIYPAVGAGWLYLALQSIKITNIPLLAFVLSPLVFCLGFLASCFYNQWLKCIDVPAKRNEINESRWAQSN